MDGYDPRRAGAWLPALTLAVSFLVASGCHSTGRPAAPGRDDRAAAAAGPDDSAARGGGDRAAAAPGGFVREVAPFEVVDEEGVAYAQPFLGGFNVPRPQFVDIDADGDLDLFVQEVPGEVRFFERTDGRWFWRTDRFGGLDVGEWYRFVDLDADGDFDVLGEERFSHVRLYRNTGDPGRAEFELHADTLLDASGRPIFSDRQNIPNVVDIDCDGRLDLFLGQVTGTVKRYESTGPDEVGMPRFELVDERWEDIEIIGAMQQSRHGANTLTFGDLDGDGDLDLFWGDFFEPGILLIRNRGTCASPSFRGEHEAFPRNQPFAASGYSAPAPADLDGDGDLDMAVGVLGGAFNANRSIVENLYLLEQDASGDFITRTSRLIRTIDVGSDSVPRLVDLDGDGDLDLLVANKIEPSDNQAGRVRLFENTGTRRRPSFRERGPLDLVPTFHQTPAPGDLDADGDLDLLVGRWNKQTDRYANEGGAFVPVAQPYLELTRGSNSTPALVDIDADGDLDLFVGEASGAINFYRNEGTPLEPAFVLVTDNFSGWKLGRRTVPVFGDLDGDGDLDLLVGTELSGVLRFENVGTAAQPEFEERGALAIPAPALAAPELGDLDGDGDLDLLVGSMSGGLLYFENRGTGS